MFVTMFELGDQRVMTVSDVARKAREQGVSPASLLEGLFGPFEDHHGTDFEDAAQL